MQNVFDDPTLTIQSMDSIRCAAKRWRADFYELNTIQFPKSPNPFFWDRLWVYQNFTKYNKVLVLDPDTIINSKAPNIFEELTDDFDFCAVRDGNPGDRFPDPVYLRDSVVKHNAMLGNTIEVFEKNIKGFSREKYWQDYFNFGVTLFYPEKIMHITEKIKSLIFENSEIYTYLNFEGGGIWFSPQNFINAILLSEDIRIKILDNNWNWIAPDIMEEFHENFFLGPMKPWIYHFTGTNGSKENLKGYDRWK